MDYSKPPRKLSILPASPNYDKQALTKIHSVFVDEEHIPECVAYDIDQGWAKGRTNGIWGAKIYGTVTVLMKDDPNLQKIKQEKEINEVMHPKANNYDVVPVKENHNKLEKLKNKKELN